MDYLQKIQKEYKNYIDNQKGGAKKKKEESDDSEVSTVESSSEERPSKEKSGYVFRIKEISVEQDSEDYKFKGLLSRTPPLNIKFSEQEVSWVKVIKASLGFVNKNLRIKFVKDVTITKGKDKQRFNKTDEEGRVKIEGSVDLGADEVYDEIKIILT